MAADTRKKDTNWRLNVNDDGTCNVDQAKLAVLMDIRDQLKDLNGIFRCHNFQSIPHTLKGIRSKLPKPKPRRTRVEKQK